LRVGEIEIVSILDGVGYEHARSNLYKPDATADPWLDHEDLLDGQGRLVLSVGGFLARSGERNVLVDAGLGAIRNDRYKGGQLLDSLAAIGLRPEDVTDVVFTHLHFDHVGWATRKGEIVFPNATYRCHSADWAHFVDRPEADPRGVRKLAPLVPRLELFDHDGSVAPGMDVRHLPGHTPGSAVVVVSSGAARAMLIGDVAHCPMELTEDEWEAVFDVDTTLARAGREALARELEGSGVAVAAAHFPGLRFGRLLSGTGRRSWRFD
jgi:glyoxylase-like metal-dependent hydrolase (beta-lactamase superfamily II)